jgi:hypothetical protein
MSYEYQFTVNAFEADGFKIGPLSFPQETFDVVLSQPLAPFTPIDGLSYNVQNGKLSFFWNAPGYEVFYAPGLKATWPGADSSVIAGLFRVDIFTHPQFAQTFVGGWVAEHVVHAPAPPPVAAAGVPEPSTAWLGLAAAVAFFVHAVLRHSRVQWEHAT